MHMTWMHVALYFNQRPAAEHGAEKLPGDSWTVAGSSLQFPADLQILGYGSSAPQRRLTAVPFGSAGIRVAD